MPTLSADQHVAIPIPVSAAAEQVAEPIVSSDVLGFMPEISPPVE